MVCGNISGNISDLVRVNTSILYPTEKLNPDTNTVYIASISSLATALIISIVVLVIVIVVILRNKAKIKAALELQPSNTAGRSIQMESMYEDVTGPSPSISVINTQDNIVYGHTKTSTTVI